MGYDESIVSNAEKRAVSFTEGGTWSEIK